MPYVLILLALCRRKPKDDAAVPDDLRQIRLIACGAFLIYAVAEVFKFQPTSTITTSSCMSGSCCACPWPRTMPWKPLPACAACRGGG